MSNPGQALREMHSSLAWESFCVSSATATAGDIVASVKDAFTIEPTALDDIELLRRVGGGDRRSFQAFYQRHAGRTLAILNRMCGDRALAEDLLQDVFLLVWRKAASYRPERGEPLGWLFAVARNKVIDNRRRSGSKIEAAEEDLTVWPDTPHSQRDDRISLEQAMAQLSADQQKALQMTYYGGYTYEEAADRLDVPLGTLKSRIKTGLRRLRTAFETTLCILCTKGILCIQGLIL